MNKATVRKISYNFPNIVFIVGKNLYDTMRELGLSTKQLYAISEGNWYDMGMCKVKLDYLYHDTPNYALHLNYKNKTLLYATDTERIDHIIAKNYDLYLIEANYDTNEELDKKILRAKEQGEFTYLERVKRTHLSELQAINFLDKNKGENSVYHFIHEHIEKEETNVPKPTYD